MGSSIRESGGGSTVFTRVEVIHIDTYQRDEVDGASERQYRIDVDRRIFNVVISRGEPTEPYRVSLKERTGMHIAGPLPYGGREEDVHAGSVVDAVFIATQQPSVSC
jgi:hypothetical protein